MHSNHCIRGHRSTNCSHNDRPLFYIRKKGRPVSQCTQCRALRKNRSLHTRCECPTRIQNKGLGGTTEFADLPQGMTIESAKQFVERLSMDQGKTLSVEKSFNDLGGCRNCNSSQCQCDGRPSASIAPASTSSSATLMSGGIPSPYSVAFSPNFSSASSSQMRINFYPINTAQYATMPQFTGIPTFSTFQSPQPQAISDVSPNITAQVQQFQRRQEHLMASTQRRIQQEAEWARKYGRDSENYLESLQHSAPILVDPYHHRSSLPISFESSSAQETVTRSLEHHSNMQQHQQYRDTRASEAGNVGRYNYVQNISQSIPYATALAPTLFHHPSDIELEQRRKSGPSIMLSQKNQSEGRVHNSNLTTQLIVESSSSSQTSLPIKATNSENGVLDDQSRTESIDEYKSHVGEEQQQEASENISKTVETDEEAVSEPFPGLEKIFDSWDATDNEWLYSLHTECARPGAVCECGDSCCCPGCFTHTNNPGDRGVYNTMLNKLGAILETGKEEQGTQPEKPSVLTSTKPATNNPDAKL